ncbi:MAG: diacylglycerol/lipid kinase family protein [Caldisericaceae bacterium]
MEKIYLIVNPAAAGGRSYEEYNLVKPFINSLNNVKTFFSEHPMHSIELARNAVLDGVERIISFGGDGTHNEVVNGVFQGLKKLYPSNLEETIKNKDSRIPAVAFVSIGSGNDLRKTLNLPKNIKEALDIALSADARWIDVGHFEFKDFDGKDASRYFVNILSGGFSGTVTMKANQGKKTAFKNIIYLNALIKTLIFATIPRGLLINGGKKIDGQFFEFDISNGKFFGGGMLLSPLSKIDDGVFNISVFRNYTGLEVLFKIYKLYNGTITREKKLYYEQAKEAYVECTPKALIEADGEVVGFTPMKVEILERSLKAVF